MNTEWRKIAELIKNNNSELTHDGKSKFAIELFLGKTWIKNTVDYIIELKTEWNLAVNCLRVLESEYATDYAYKIYKNSTNKDDRRIAVLVIKDIAHPKSIHWITEFLNDENVADFGLGVLDQLLWTEKIKPNKMTESLLNLAAEKKHDGLSEKVEFIRKYLTKKSSC
ncbi:hypothetical protein [Mesonia mobilis]|uniref:HEAT repeat domain-containing protein n=1 Tax=Mesonia mobilis TaxID=369791 RepID=A0ABQ3C246_9FLAO|nr:hypothetical protein [Mesonia mobilis]MBQ0739270.1 hypothetical protein [Aquimarina celericrescens]GGZ65209.1 hypothetical protein GCM10008088_28210 [Mesonia mobilis]